MKPKAFIISSVRKATPEMLAELDRVEKKYTEIGYDVHVPHKHTNQTKTGFEICKENMEAIKKADLIIIIYYKDSTGTHFDMGVAFALGKEIVIERALVEGSGRTFSRMLVEWESKGDLPW